MPQTEGSPRRILSASDADEITQIFDQARLDSFVEAGVLEGDWKAGKASAKQGEESDAKKGK
jgi:hypothetical protein